MPRYIKKFESVSDFNAYMAQEDVVLPNVYLVKSGETRSTLTFNSDNVGGKTETKNMQEKEDSPISISLEGIGVGDQARIDISLPDDATGVVTLTILDVKYTTPILEGGRARFEIWDLPAGIHTVYANYDGDDNFKAAFSTEEIEVSKVTPEWEGIYTDDTDWGEVMIVAACIPEDATGYVTFTINGNSVSEPAIDGCSNAFISPELYGNPGVKTISLSYEGDEKYLPITGSTTCEVFEVE